MKSEKGNNKFNEGLFDDKLKSLFEDHKVTSISPNWTKMSGALEDEEIDTRLQSKLKQHSDYQAPFWQKVSLDLDLIYARRKHIFVKQVLEITLALLIFLTIGQGLDSFYLNNIFNNNTKIEIEPMSSKLENENIKSISNNSDTKLSNSVKKTGQTNKTNINKAANKQSIVGRPNISSNNNNSNNLDLKSTRKSIVKNVSNQRNKGIDKQVNSKEFQQQDLNKITKSELLKPTNVLTIGYQKELANNNIHKEAEIKTNNKSITTQLSNIDLLRLSKLDYHLIHESSTIDISKQVDNIQYKEVDVQNKKPSILIAPHISYDINNIQYPKDTFFGYDTIPIHTWSDTTVSSSNVSYGLSFIMPKKYFILEADISISSIKSNHHKTYVMGKDIQELARWTLNSERFDLYSLGINLNPIIYKSPKFTAHGILGTKLNIVYKYTPDTLLTLVQQGEVDPGYNPHPKTKDEESGQALFASNNSGQNDNYSFVMLKFGLGTMYKVDRNISIMARASYNYNYLNKYISKSTAKINTFNTKVGIMYHF